MLYWCMSRSNYARTGASMAQKSGWFSELGEVEIPKIGEVCPPPVDPLIMVQVSARGWPKTFHSWPSTFRFAIFRPPQKLLSGSSPAAITPGAAADGGKPRSDDMKSEMTGLIRYRLPRARDPIHGAKYRE